MGVRINFRLTCAKFVSNYEAMHLRKNGYISSAEDPLSPKSVAIFLERTSHHSFRLGLFLIQITSFSHQRCKNLKSSRGPRRTLAGRARPRLIVGRVRFSWVNFLRLCPEWPISKNVTWLTGCPEWPFSKNITWLTGGTEWPFRCLDSCGSFFLLQSTCRILMKLWTQA